MIRQTEAFTHAPHILKGSILALLAFFFMAVFGVFTKVATEYGDPIWVSFITYLIASLGTGLFMLPQGLAGLKSQHYRYLIARAVIGTSASFLYMISMRYIPIVNSTLLFNTAPIFIPLLTVSVLKISIHKSIWIAVIIGFIGILVIIKPGSDLLTDPGNLIGLLSGFALAVAYLIMKFLTSTDTGMRIIFYYFTIGMLMQIPLLWFTNQSLSFDAFFFAALSGVMLMLAQICLVRAYLYAAASQVGVYQYASVVFVALIEWIVWSRTPDLLDCIGFILVSVAGIFIIFSSGPKSSAKLSAEH